MKKMTFNKRSLAAVGAALLMLSCAQGFDNDEHFNAGVTNAQLESPAIDRSCISTVANADGSESVILTWPVVLGAGGYDVTVADVNDPANPVYLIDEKNLDGCTVTFPKNEDTDYLIAVKALGNEKLNNKEALNASEYAYSTWAPMTTIPSGADLATAISLVEPEDPELGQGFSLAAGGTYTVSSAVDFGLYNVTLKGDESNPPTITMQNDAMLITQAGLKIKNINFDCSASTATSLVAFSADPDASISTEALGYKNDGANQDGFIIEKPVIFDGCMVKNLPNSLIWGQKKNWSLRDFRILSCIIQLNNAGSATFLDLSSASNGLIKELSITNSTIYNLVKNSSAYFLRFSNASNAQPQKIFGDSQKSITHRIENCTIAKVFTAKDFANNMPTVNTMTDYVSNVIFYDVYRIYQYILNNHTRYTSNNTMWYYDASPQDNDTGGRTDSNGNPFTTLEDPGFTEPFVELDLTKPNGGVNFKATGAISSKIGDPRWR